MKKSTINAHFVLFKKYTSKKTGLIPITLRLTQDRSAIHLKSHIEIEEKQWNDKKRCVRSNHPNHQKYNNWLKEKISTISDIITESPNLTKEQLKDLLSKKTPEESDLISLYKDFKSELINDGHYDEAKHAKVVIEKLIAFTGKQKIPINSVNSRFIQEFQDYLRNVVKNSPNTINKEMQRLKRVLKNAKKLGLIQQIPFEDYKGLKRTKSRKAKLSLQQIEALAKLDLKKKSQLCLVRDAFLFSFYNGGLRFGDLCKLTWMDVRDGRLVYEMSKTGTFKDIPLHQKPLSIIAKYKKKSHSEKHALLPIIEDPLELSKIEFNRKKSSYNARFNTLLKELAQLAKIEESISFHVARHSFADYARREKIPITDIKNMLGHSSISITEDYLNELDKQSMDESMNKLFGS